MFSYGILFKGGLPLGELDKESIFVAKILLQYGVLVLDGGLYRFPSPYHELCYMMSKNTSNRPR